MSHEVRQTELQEKTQQLLRGSLKYVRAAALAAALVPLASVAAAPAAAQDPCPSSGTVCVPPSDQPPGTGTPGYWKTHQGAWPVSTITVGGVSYTRDEAIGWLGKVGKDKSITMFSSLVSAKLNVLLGNRSDCVDGTIVAADSWMATNGLGKNIAGSSAAWAIGEPLHIEMDTFNNGLSCAPHRL